MASTNLKARGSGYSPELDDAERASRDEIMALQKKRLAWSLKHAYDNVAHYQARPSTRPACIPPISASCPISPNFRSR